MGRNALDDELFSLTSKTVTALTRNAPLPAVEEESFERISDIVLFLRSQDMQQRPDILRAISENDQFDIIYDLALESPHATSQLDVITDLVARNAQLGEIFHELASQSNLQSGIRLLSIARKNLIALASNPALDTLIKPVSTFEWNWAVSEKDKKPCIELLVQTLEEIALDEDATSALVRNQSYGATFKAFEELATRSKNPMLANRISLALSSLEERFPPTPDHPITR